MGYTVSVSIVVLIVSLFASVPPVHAQLEDVIARAKPAVVVVTTKHVLGGGARGSGFIFDPSGFVLTSHHVVEGAVEITVALPDKRTFSAEVVDYVRKVDYAGTEFQTVTDGAILKISAAGLPTLPLGDSSTLRQGQELIVLGYPSGVGTEDVSAIRGIVSAVRTGWIQTDAAIEPGTSGGPVLDRQGRVVGLATFVTGPLRKVAGAVSINSLREVTLAALNSAGPRTQEIRVTGMEYAGAIRVGRRRAWVDRYDPGVTSSRRYTREFTEEVIQVQGYVGALVYTVRVSEGFESKEFIGAEGLSAICGTSGGSITSCDEPILLFPFPPIVGRTWQSRYRTENPAQATVWVTTTNGRIENSSEVVTVPAGRFPEAIRIVEVSQELWTRGSQRQTRRTTASSWFAPTIGPVRRVTEVTDTGERYVRVLSSATP